MPPKKQPVSKAATKGNSKDKKAAPKAPKTKKTTKPVQPPPAPVVLPSISTILPSPTGSIGSEFDTVNPPRPEVLNAVRLPYVREQADVPVGLKNPSLLCYRNAVLAMLINTERFMSYIQHWWASNVDSSHPDQSAPPARLLLRALEHLGLEYWSEDPAPKEVQAALVDFWKVAGLKDDKVNDLWQAWTGAGRGRSRQEDAGEFLTWLLTAINNQLAGFGLPMTGLSRDQDDFASLFQVGRTVRKRNCVGYPTIGCCANLKRRIAGIDTTTVLTIAVDQSKKAEREEAGQMLTLEDCIAASTRSVVDAALCSVCSKKQKDEAGKAAGVGTTDGSAVPVSAINSDHSEDNPAVPYSSRMEDHEWSLFRDLPEVLFISLSRWKTFGGRANEKLTDKVKILETLDLTPFLEQRGLEPGTKAEYRLSAVVSHAGDSRGGHYITHVKADEKWWEINDLDVKEAAFESISEETGEWSQNMPWTPYILAWERIPHLVVAEVPEGIEEAERKKAEEKRLEAERLEQERLEEERLKKELLEKDRQELERLEQERKMLEEEAKLLAEEKIRLAKQIEDKKKPAGPEGSKKSEDSIFGSETWRPDANVKITFTTGNADVMEFKHRFPKSFDSNGKCSLTFSATLTDAAGQTWEIENSGTSKPMTMSPPPPTNEPRPTGSGEGGNGTAKTDESSGGKKSSISSTPPEPTPPAAPTDAAAQIQTGKRKRVDDDSGRGGARKYPKIDGIAIP